MMPQSDSALVGSVCVKLMFLAVGDSAVTLASIQNATSVSFKKGQAADLIVSKEIHWL
jgi:hypothetical protein